MVSCTLDFPNKSNPCVSLIVEAVDTACVHRSYLGLQVVFRVKLSVESGKRMKEAIVWYYNLVGGLECFLLFHPLGIS